MIAITTFFGRQIEVKETDEIYYTELNAMLDSKRWGTGLRKHLPVNVWISEPPRPFEDERTNIQWVAFGGSIVE